MISILEHLLIFLLGICIASLEIIYSNGFVYFSIGIYSFLMLNYRCFKKYILDRHLESSRICQYFLPFCRLSSHSAVSLASHNYVILIWGSISQCLCRLAMLLVSHAGNYCQIQSHEYFFCAFAESFIGLAITFPSLIHFEKTLYTWGQGPTWFFHMHTSSFLSTIHGRDCPSLQWTIMISLPKILWPMY